MTKYINYCHKCKSAHDPLYLPTVPLGCMDDKPAKHQIFLLLGKNESCAAEGCMGSLAALKGRPCIYATLRPPVTY